MFFHQDGLSSYHGDLSLSWSFIGCSFIWVIFHQVDLTRVVSYQCGLSSVVLLYFVCFVQNYLREQRHTKYNLVCETLQFLDCICGSTTGGLGLLGLYINESNVDLITQALVTLTEYCQGPCHENQVDGGLCMGSSGEEGGGATSVRVKLVSYRFATLIGCCQACAMKTSLVFVFVHGAGGLWDGLGKSVQRVIH